MKTKQIIYTAFFAIFTAIGAFITIPIGPIPFTLQSLFVVLSGIFLGPYFGPLSQMLYVFLGLIGLPIFSQFTGGVSIIFKPNFGYILGFILASFFSGVLNQNLKHSKYKYFLISIISSLSIYILGVPYMYIILNYVSNITMSFTQCLLTGFIIFIPSDLLKVIIISIVSKSTRHLQYNFYN